MHNVILKLPWLDLCGSLTYSQYLDGRQEAKRETPKHISCLDSIKLVEFRDLLISTWETFSSICIKFCSGQQDHGILDYLSCNKKKGLLKDDNTLDFRFSYIQKWTKGRRKHYQHLRNVFLIYGGCLKSLENFTGANKKNFKTKRQSFCQICVSNADNLSHLLHKES